MVATFNETGARTSKKYVAEQDISMTNWSKPLQSFCEDSPVFAFKKNVNNVKFWGFFTSKRTFFD